MSELTIEDIGVIFGLVLMLAGGIGGWYTLKMKVSFLEKKFKEVCDQKKECFARFDQLFKELKEDREVHNQAETKIAVIGQKLDDLILLTKNGGRKNAR